METKQGLPILAFASPAKWEEWLQKHHKTSKGLWLKIAKKGSGETTVTYAEALDVALCHGWIDGQKGSLDEAFFLQRFTPRGPRSKWSKINRDKVDALVKAKRMRPAGLAEVEAAKADGRWEAAYDGQRTITVPEDLQKELDANPKAAAFFATLSSVNRYAILYRIQDAKKPETRAARIAKFLGMLERGETVHG
ncbi:MAG TPA: YdeI/OmpD-associated family protein [Thermoanaerobaculia bacterium]|jgi:uncharacterized protein YdeI (YjbR/CyaY-like superfamily)|nr:YdeI/OmpD-associated family protein [Thermoanaerobaculia bacterium]